MSLNFQLEVQMTGDTITDLPIMRVTARFWNGNTLNRYIMYEILLEIDI